MSEKSWKQIREELKTLPRQMCVTPVAEALEYIDEILKLQEQLQSAQQEIERLGNLARQERELADHWMRKHHDDVVKLREEREKLIEGLRWYAEADYDHKTMTDYYEDDGEVFYGTELDLDRGQRARNILREIGVTVEW